MTRTVMATQTGVEAGELASFCASLEEVEQASSGYGSLRRAVIETEISGTLVIATFADNQWHLTFGVTS